MVPLPFLGNLLCVNPRVIVQSARAGKARAKARSRRRRCRKNERTWPVAVHRPHNKRAKQRAGVTL